MKRKDEPKLYGYRINVNKPPFDELYRRFKKWKGIPIRIPLSDDERREFEDYVLKCRGGESNNER